MNKTTGHLTGWEGQSLSIREFNCAPHQGGRILIFSKCKRSLGEVLVCKHYVILQIPFPPMTGGGGGISIVKENLQSYTCMCSLLHLCACMSVCLSAVCFKISN